MNTETNTVRRLTPCLRCSGYRWEDTGEPVEVRWHGRGFPSCLCARAQRPDPVAGERLSALEYEDHLNGVLGEAPSVRRLLGATLFAGLVLCLSPVGLTLPYLFLAGMLYMAVTAVT